VDEIEQVPAFGLVQLQRAGERFEDGVGDTGRVAPFQPRVVVDADPGQQRDFLPAEPGDPAMAAVGGQTGPFRREPGPA
jgi:hypothetical protein